MPERMRSERSRDRAGPEAGEAVAVATNAAPKKNDPPGRSDLRTRPDTVAQGLAIIDPQATATALAALQGWFLLPLRNIQIWQEAWLRLLPR